jgi:hypothetical protein
MNTTEQELREKIARHLYIDFWHDHHPQENWLSHYWIEIKPHIKARFVERAVAVITPIRADCARQLREVHSPFGIYDECEHEHTEEDVMAGVAIDVEEVGITCKEALMYYVCKSCCTLGGYQSETCANSHEHGKDIPICETAKLADTWEGK